MKVPMFVKAAMAVLLLVALVYWREIWAWVDAKTWSELSGDILGFVLKWFYLAIFGFLAATLPHYIMPWLKLLRRNGNRRLRRARRNSHHHPVTNDRKLNVNQAVLNFLLRKSGVEKNPPTSSHEDRPNIKL